MTISSDGGNYFHSYSENYYNGYTYTTGVQYDDFTDTFSETTDVLDADGNIVSETYHIFEADGPTEGYAYYSSVWDDALDELDNGNCN